MTQSSAVRVSESQAAEGMQWWRQRGNGGPQEMSKGVDSETQPCAACVEECSIPRPSE